MSASSDIDVSLIDALLALSPEQRLRQNDRMLKAIQDLRHGFSTLADLRRGSTSEKDKLTLAMLEATLRRRGRDG